MKDIKGFCKLIDINIPDFSEFEYYIDQYSKTEKWKNIRYLIKLFEQTEEKYENVQTLRYNKAEEIINFLKNTNSYNRMISDNLIPNLPCDRNFVPKENTKYLSIDIRKANWTVLKSYDLESELKDTYDDFIEGFYLPEIFNYSKQFRQYIFGNISPSKQIKVQRTIIQTILDKYDYLDLYAACIKTDEIIYSFDSYDQISDILDKIDQDKFKVKLFTVKKVEDFRIDTYLSESGEELYKEMVGCNGNKFFMNLKKYILDEPLDIRDLYFRMDGDLAIWNVDNLKINL